MIDWSDGKTEITGQEAIKQLEAFLLEKAEATDILHIPTYAPIRQSDLLATIEDIQKALVPLADQDRTTYWTGECSLSFNARFEFVLESRQTVVYN